jgi:hypothetical protein
MSVNVDLVAATFRRAADQEFATSPHWSFLSRQIASDPELLKIAAVTRPGEFPPYLVLAAVHQLVLKGEAPELEPFYPSAGGNRVPDGDFFLAFRECALRQRDRLAEVVARRNVNKTVLRRCACLRPLLIEAARWLEAERVHLIDIGCSAGLNLLLDRWGVVYEPGHQAGPLDAPVTVRTELRGAVPPLDGMPEIVERIGLDLDRIDMADPDDRTWILANLFPDDTDFDVTLRAAEELLRSPPKFVIGDAAVTLPGAMRELEDSLPIVLMESILGYHFNTRQRLELLRGANEAANGRRVARICMNASPTGDAQLAIAVGDVRQLVLVGAADRDGKWMAWNGSAA